MSEPAISIRDLGKKYRLGMKQKSRQNFREALVDVLTSPVRRFRGLGENGTEEDSFWALQEVSFDVEPGDVVGVIGRNGAGKSTLLKILSRITEPTTGEAVIRGRLSSLLEVGTGFHKELTGRENIFLNGAILGMRRTEIARKFDEIVAFAEVEKFLDTPVKRYSSGMYVRLAFAVAAHLEPEILVVDEVLAVGDASFQKKCLGKMGEVARGGRTVLFVSHNMAAVQNLCTRGVVLNRGTVVLDGSPSEAVSHYFRALESVSEGELAERTDRAGKGLSRLTDLRVFSTDSGGDNHPITGRPLNLEFRVSKPMPGLCCNFTIYGANGEALVHCSSRFTSEHDVPERDEHVFRCEFEELPLLPGRYRVNAALHSGRELQDHVEAAAYFDVGHGSMRGRTMDSESSYGLITAPHRWHIPARYL